MTYNFNWFGGIKRLLGRSDATLRENIEDVLDDAQNGNMDFSDEEQHMLRNLLGFRDIRVEDVMVPRADIIAVDETISLKDLMQEFSACAHSRMPIYNQNLDTPRGMVHIKDVMTLITEGRKNFSAADLLREVLFVPPSMPALDLLLKMQASRTHMALVIDEYGGTDGLVTIENLVEEIVGEIEDEHDDGDAALIKYMRENQWEAHARLPIEDLEDILGLKFTHEEIDEIDTLGGLVFTHAGRVPQRGEIITMPIDEKNASIEFSIKDADPRRIKTIILRLIASKDTGIEE